MSSHHGALRSMAILSGLLTLAGTTAWAQEATPSMAAPDPTPAPYILPPVDGTFDYQIGGDYELPDGVEIVSRDWFIGSAPEDAYGICYVNAYQTQDDERGVDRPDERSNWPANLVLTTLGDDPNWGGEYLIDVSTPRKRERAAAWVEPMISTCEAKGFEAVEFDNLDSWTRFRGTPVQRRVPITRPDAVAYAQLLVGMAHDHGLAAAQKNTVQLPRSASRDRIRFDFAIAEECGRWNECQAYRDVFDDHVIVIEYRKRDFDKTCRQVGDALSVVLRDVNVTRPGSATYRYRAC
jgi:Glycoside-hydrolase family GH114